MNPIRTLLPMASDGVGPSFTCVSLIEGYSAAGVKVDLFTNRFRTPTSTISVHATLPGPLKYIPYRLVDRSASFLLERWFISRLVPGDIAYLWPQVSLRTHERAKRFGARIILEGINTRMKAAKALLDQEYDRLGIPPQHGITSARVAEEEAKYSLADAIFAPSPGVEKALAGSALEHRWIATSYGVAARTDLGGAEQRGSSSDVTYLFCGYASVRKGIHHLLRIWPTMPQNARLRIVGRIEPVIAELFSASLDDPRIEIVGFVRDVWREYAAADVFVLPSLEEGDPLATYEAASSGLPIVASPMGAGRIGAATKAAILIDPQNRDELEATLTRIHISRDERFHYGQLARSAVEDYNWGAVSRRRIKSLAEFLERDDA